MPSNLRTLPRTLMADVSVGAGQIEAGAVTGVELSATARRKNINRTVPTVPTGAGTTEITVVVPHNAVLASVRFAFKDALAANDTNYVTFAVKNKGQAGAGTTDLLSTGASSTTKATGGTALAAYVQRQLVLTGTPSDLNLTAGDVLAVQVVGAGTLANTLTEGSVNIGLDVLA